MILEAAKGLLSDIQVEDIVTGQPITGYLYHGSRESKLTALKPSMPSYRGGLGRGVYLAEKEDAEFYKGAHRGPGLYRCLVRLKNPYVLDPAPLDDFPWKRYGTTFERAWRKHVGSDWQAEQGPPESILVGESVPPFVYVVDGKYHIVADGSDLEDVGATVEEAGYDSVVAIGLRLRSSTRHEVLVFRTVYPDSVDGQPVKVGRRGIEVYAEARVKEALTTRDRDGGWGKNLDRFPALLQQEIMDERRMPTEEDIAWIASWQAPTAPVTMNISDLLRMPVNLGVIARCPKDVVGEINQKCPVRFMTRDPSVFASTAR